MAEIHNDFERLRQFANALQQYIDNLDEANNFLDQNFSDIGEVWCDDNYREFEEVYGQLRQIMKGFQDNCAHQIPYLQQPANILEEAHNLRTSL